jgi:two-component system copper resistance phosphate regulon response regulator CusR
MLPKIDGITLCKALRAARVTTPVLMLTAKDSLNDRVKGLECGADDFLGKPFQFEELHARIRALIRRDKIVKSAKISVADMTVDTAARIVSRAGRRIWLTNREYTLLEALAARIGQVVTRETILTSVWVDEFSTSNTVDVHVRNLRKKVDDGFEPKLIHTVFGIGYVLQSDEGRPTHDSN